MINLQSICKEVSKNTGYDYDLVYAVCRHVFKETVDIMKSDSITKDIMFNKLFKFKLKKRYKENKTKEYTIK